jgi:hypothetical protein
LRQPSRRASLREGATKMIELVAVRHPTHLTLTPIRGAGERTFAT